MKHNLGEKFEYRGVVVQQCHDNVLIQYDQFGTLRMNDTGYHDGEIELDNRFSEIVQYLKTKKNPRYTMIELGSNWGYYSLIFQKILQPNAFTILVEPFEAKLQRGIANFKINDVEGIFVNKAIGSTHKGNSAQIINVPSTTLTQLLKTYWLHFIDILHCDIDGSELIALEESKYLFTDKRIRYVFLLTHNKNVPNVHEDCKKLLTDAKYEILFEVTNGTIGCDDLIIAKA